MAEKLYGYSASGLFGYSHMYGGYPGGQAEYARVPFADIGPLKVPDSLTDEQVLFLSDIFPTGYMAADNCQIKPGDTVAVWGCGPARDAPDPPCDCDGHRGQHLRPLHCQRRLHARFQAVRACRLHRVEYGRGQRPRAPTDCDCAQRQHRGFIPADISPCATQQDRNRTAETGVGKMTMTATMW
jgi:hypothetical protein